MNRAVACECGDHCFMNLNRGYVTIFDPEDVHLAKGFFWVRIVNKHTVYVMHQHSRGSKNLRFHREVMNAPPEMQVDHRYGNGMDNRKRSLRLATVSQNQRNKHPRENCSSKYMGVSIDKRRKPFLWKVSIQSDGNAKVVGRFMDEIQAARAYDAEAQKLHGEFARLNFPEMTAAPS